MKVNLKILFKVFIAGLIFLMAGGLGSYSNTAEAQTPEDINRGPGDDVYTLDGETVGNINMGRAACLGS